MLRYLPFLLFVYPAISVAIEVGDTCTNSTKLPSQKICWEDVVVDCTGKQSNLGRVESTVCADSIFRVSDRKLNATYQTIIKKLSKPVDASLKEKLVEAQRSWVRFRDAECQIQEEITKGGWTDVFVIECKNELTKERTRALERTFKQ